MIEAPAPWDVDSDDLSAILLTEMWGHHAGYAERAHAYRPAIAETLEVARRFTDAGRYLAAQARRAEGAAAWEDWMARRSIDLVLEATLPIMPPRRGPGYERGHAPAPATR